MVKRIVIIGGGTAGWLTTLNFLRHTDNPEIINISSDELPIIGVGESTTGLTNDIIKSKRNIEIDELDFLKNTNSTYKLGIWHKDWHTIGESFISPLGDEFLNDSGHPTSDYDYYRIYHVAKNNMKYNQTQARFIENNKLQFLNISEDDYYKPVFNNQNGKVDFSFHHVAYHVDTFKVGKYIKDKVINHDRVKYFDDIVTSVEKDEHGYVKKLLLKSGQIVEGDLFVDCTGFFRLLIDDENKFIDYSNNLLTNRAISFITKDTDIKNCTTATARKYGWEWTIPLQHRNGRGYVFNDNMISVDEAVEELCKIYGEIEVQKDISFKPGRITKAWDKNVISTGLSTGFVEPLEATTIHMTLLQINLFLEQYYTEHLDFKNDSQHKNYNRAIGDTWDDIRDFINLHYTNTRQDTEFWKESSKEERRSNRLNDLLETWKSIMPRLADYSSSNYLNFYKLGNTLWYQILIGMKILNPSVAEKELKAFKLWEVAERDYFNRQQFNNHVIELGVDTQHFYETQLNSLKDYRRVQL